MKELLGEVSVGGQPHLILPAADNLPVVMLVLNPKTRLSLGHLINRPMVLTSVETSKIAAVDGDTFAGIVRQHDGGEPVGIRIKFLKLPGGSNEEGGQDVVDLINARLEKVRLQKAS